MINLSSFSFKNILALNRATLYRSLHIDRIVDGSGANPRRFFPSPYAPISLWIDNVERRGLALRDYPGHEHTVADIIVLVKFRETGSARGRLMRVIDIYR